ncbi:hypothetical protein [Changchengzhania lutea]|uniref:hypothetical protein n=1 Tax=Changchengzhania lutea TaxID=2049305 RepID=UPI00163DCC84|nr:hypothetical protein [Changchengzhania lutea]
MNTIRISGIVILIVGIIMNRFLNNDGIDFVSGLLIGLGIGTIITGQISTKYNHKKC